MSNIPDNAPESCPGTGTEKSGKASGCAGCPNQRVCASGEKPVDPDIDSIQFRMSAIKHKVLILSGKGGVGKSSVATNLAWALAADGTRQVGVLDVDICGPSQARMFGVEGQTVQSSGSGWSPIYVQDNLCVMSIAFLLDNRDEAVIWRGPRKNGLIKQFLKDVNWEELDYLIIDTPPGTSDEHISIVQLLLQAGALDGAVIVTTPQEVALLDVRKEINFCRKTKVPILGVVENMSYHVCPCCTEKIVIFPSTTGGAKKMCEDMNLDLLGQLPHDTQLATVLDNGEVFAQKHADSILTSKFEEIARSVIEKCEEETKE
jgi:Mrp family chromosome partitioning ATPase|uniref:Cytosolic Fe-S cluster assembly factor NUBP1 homolog n=1 Tax=Panagrolaimus sp. PS1159 TaxID=55785 RepID=A0AC35GW61_9BILA